MHWQDAVAAAMSAGFARAALIPARKLDSFVHNERYKFIQIDPHALMAGAKSILVAAMPFAWHRAWPDGYAEVSAYYFQSQHAHIAKEALAERLASQGVQVQSGDKLPHKPLGVLAGMGVMGRNCLLHNDAWGSCFTLRVLLTDIAPQEAVEPMPAHACGTCIRCVKACPTDALYGDGRLNTERCVRAHMMQKEAVPDTLRTPMRQRLLGCEDCQRVCPQNAHIDGIAPPYEAYAIDALLRSAPETLRRVAEQIGTNEARKQRVQTQTALAAGNTRDARHLPALEALTGHENPAIAEHVRWAIDTIRKEYHS